MTASPTTARRMLVAYVSHSGSTKEVARAIGEALSAQGHAVTVESVTRLDGVDGYDALLLGGPVIFGWHALAELFLQKHQAALSGLPVAWFITCGMLTDPGAPDAPTTAIDGVPVFLDPQHAQPRRATLNPLALLKQRSTTPHAYLRPTLKKFPALRPVSVAFLGGKVDYATLGVTQKTILRYAVRAEAGDFRHWDVIRAWAVQVGEALAGPPDA